MFDKPFKTFDEQLAIIEGKNIEINDPAFALECLQTISYYSLINGYKDLFNLEVSEEDGEERFTDAIPFDNIYTLHTLDSNLNNILFKYIIQIEKSLKTKIAYVVSRNYGEDTKSYLDFENYTDNGVLDRKSEINNIKSQIENSKKCVSIVHYKQTKNHIPAWIGTNGIFFGSAINWYKVMQTKDKNEICESFLMKVNLNSLDKKKAFLSTSLTLLQTYRNNIAHGNRTFKSNVSNELPKKELLEIIEDDILTEDEYQKDIGRNDLFAVFITIVILINDIYMINNFILDVQSAIEPYKELELCPGNTVLETLNLPTNYIERLEKLKNNKFK